MLPSNKMTNDRSSSPSVKALLNHYYHSSNREKLKEKQNILQTVDDNSTEGIEEEEYHVSSVRSSSKDSRHKKLEDDYCRFIFKLFKLVPCDQFVCAHPIVCLNVFLDVLGHDPLFNRFIYFKYY